MENKHIFKVGPIDKNELFFMDPNSEILHLHVHFCVFGNLEDKDNFFSHLIFAYLFGILPAALKLKYTGILHAAIKLKYTGILHAAIKLKYTGILPAALKLIN
jgi:hypothetical protein